MLKTLRRSAIEQFGELPDRVVVGRPVHFSSAQNDADDELATTRLAVAIRRAGWKEITFEFEPVAAAYHYAASIEREELILVADFGGGTSDFSIVRLRPMATTPTHRRYEFSPTTASRSPVMRSTVISCAAWSRPNSAVARSTAHHTATSCRCRPGTTRRWSAGTSFRF